MDSTSVTDKAIYYGKFREVFIHQFEFKTDPWKFFFYLSRI